MYMIRRPAYGLATARSRFMRDVGRTLPKSHCRLKGLLTPKRPHARSALRLRRPAKEAGLAAGPWIRVRCSSCGEVLDSVDSGVRRQVLGKQGLIPAEVQVP